MFLVGGIFARIIRFQSIDPNQEARIGQDRNELLSGRIKDEEKNIRLLQIVCIIMLLVTANVVIASADIADAANNKFNFELQPYGGKKASDKVIKQNSKENAEIYFDGVESYVMLPYLRLRSGTNDQAASVLYTIDNIYMEPIYLNGYGQKGLPYYFRAQTDSSSSGRAFIYGVWLP